MKKLQILALMILLPLGAFAAGPLLGDAQGATTETGTLIGTLLFIAVVAIWMLPFVFGIMVYAAQKKKAEQNHEDLGVKAALLSLVAIIIGGAAAFYIVGSIGSLALGLTTTDLTKGNSYFLKPLFDKGLANI